MLRGGPPPYHPDAEMQALVQEDAQDPVRVAYERRNRDLDSQLVWRGKSGALRSGRAAPNVVRLL